jgi:hypothetical protein
MSNGLLDIGRTVPELLDTPIQLHMLANGVVAEQAWRERNDAQLQHPQSSWPLASLGDG